MFRQQFDRFNNQILRESGKPFTSFHDGLPDEWEAYKDALRTIARDRLAFEEWRPRDIGTGRIIERLIQAIEVAQRPDVPRNNLVAWRPRHGPQSQSHRALLDARESRSALRRFEQWGFEFFQSGLADQEAFDELVEMAGRRYDLVAYLFYLKDWKRYMPIAPETFDEAFVDLGIPLKTSRNCSWENYSQYNAALADIRKALRDLVEVDARLIDAHSYCWMLTRLKSDSEVSNRPLIPIPRLVNRPKPVSSSDDLPVSRTATIVTEGDFLEREKAQRRLGKIAEQVAIVAEQRRLQQGGRSDLAQFIELVSDRPALGYDILSFELDGSHRHIEAKATRRSGRRFQFFLSRNEWSQCRQLSNYYFYLVVNATSPQPSVFMVRASDLRSEGLSAMTYLASLEWTG